MSRPVATIAGTAVISVLVLLGVHILFPQRAGVVAFTQVIEPFIVLSALIVAPLALPGRARWRIAVVLGLVALAALRYGPLLVSLPSSAASDATMHVATWNLLAGGPSVERAVTGLANADLDIVGLQELQPRAAAALSADPTTAARYPFRVLAPESSVLGMGLLSRYPIVSHEEWSDPPLIRAVVAPVGAEPVTVFVAHPLPARIDTLVGVPMSLQTARRDADIAFIRSLVEAELETGRAVLVLGDLNVTEREPAYATFAQGLDDAHLNAGIGPGLTWLPEELAFLPFGLLRIDYIFTSPALQASGMHVDCRARSDHCLVVADIRDTRLAGRSLL